MIRSSSAGDDGNGAPSMFAVVAPPLLPGGIVLRTANATASPTSVSDGGSNALDGVRTLQLSGSSGGGEGDQPTGSPPLGRLSDGATFALQRPAPRPPGRLKFSLNVGSKQPRDNARISTDSAPPAIIAVGTSDANQREVPVDAAEDEQQVGPRRPPPCTTPSAAAPEITSSRETAMFSLDPPHDADVHSHLQEPMDRPVASPSSQDLDAGQVCLTDDRRYHHSPLPTAVHPSAFSPTRDLPGFAVTAAAPSVGPTVVLDAGAIPPPTWRTPLPGPQPQPPPPRPSLPDIVAAAPSAASGSAPTAVTTGPQAVMVGVVGRDITAIQTSVVQDSQPHPLRLTRQRPPHVHYSWMNGDGPMHAAIPNLRVPSDAPLTLYPVTNAFEDRYQVKTKLGEGTYGEVYVATDKQTRQCVAVKRLKILQQLEGFPITSVREIVIHRHLAAMMHLPPKQPPKTTEVPTAVLPSALAASWVSLTPPPPSIAPSPRFLQHISLLRDVRISRDWQSTYLVFDFVDHSLSGLLGRGFAFKEEDVSHIFAECLVALAGLHAAGIIHRDIKTNNILVDHTATAKLCDFGLAFAEKSDRGRYTASLVALDFRPPEMLLHAAKYTGAVDVWALGCALAQVFIGYPPFSQSFHEKYCGRYNFSKAGAVAKDVESARQATSGKPSQPSPLALHSEVSQLITIAKVFGCKVHELLPRDSDVFLNADAKAQAVMATERSQLAASTTASKSSSSSSSSAPHQHDVRGAPQRAELRRFLQFAVSVGPCRTRWRRISDHALCAIEGLLTLDPNQRPTAEQAVRTFTFFSSALNDERLRKSLEGQLKTFTKGGFWHDVVPGTATVNQ